MIARLGRLVIGVLNRLVPKRHKAVLSGYPDLEDSILEIAKRLATEGEFEVVVLTHHEVPPAVRASIPVTWGRTRSLAGLFHYLTARLVFFTHGLYLSPEPPASQICINVWHGMPFKKIGHLIGNVPPPASLVVATSDLFQDIVARCFGVERHRVPITGLPRNDVLIRASRRSRVIKEALGVSTIGPATRLVTWLPTYRHAVRGADRIDGMPHSSIFGMPDLDVGEFDRLLEEHDCVCVIKPHPMAAAYDTFSSNGRVRVIADQDLTENRLSLYELVGATDLLITDASSVYVDFLLVDKPIVLAFPDFDIYRQTRGFGLEPVEEYLAGPLVASFASLKNSISEALAVDPYRPERHRLLDWFHKYADDQATERLVDLAMRAVERMQSGEHPIRQQKPMFPKNS